MRKFLLATSALVAFAGVAQAAPSPIDVTVGGYVDFRAAQFHESSIAPVAANRRSYDFETAYKVNVEAAGKASNGIEYGALVSLTNEAVSADGYAAGGTTAKIDQSYVWLSGGWGKALFGDSHGASDLFVSAPTVGEGQIDGKYVDFTDSLVRLRVAGVDAEENSTKVSYFTPKVGNANHKLQAAVSFAPNVNNQGQSVVTRKNTVTYNDFLEGSVQYTGNWNPVTAVISATASGANGNNTYNDFASFGFGAQLGYAGFTVGGSYVDTGDYDTLTTDKKSGDVWTIGGKYEFDKTAVAINYLDGSGRFPLSGETVKNFSAVGVGATYTWFPGLTSAVDAVLFSQDHVAAKDNDGHVFMLSQKLAF